MKRQKKRENKKENWEKRKGTIGRRRTVGGAPSTAACHCHRRRLLNSFSHHLSLAEEHRPTTVDDLHPRIETER